MADLWPRLHDLATRIGDTVYVFAATAVIVVALGHLAAISGGV